jgi:hypothetical protein
MASRRRNPYNSLTYDLIGHLQYLFAVRLANNSQLPESLVATRKAQVYAPSFEAATTLMTQLIDLMKNLQTQMAGVEQQLRERPNTSLTTDGKIALAQARQGFGPLEVYMKSNELAQVVTDRKKAQARSVWLGMGLQPEEGECDERAAALLQVVGSIFSTQPATLDALAAAFERERATQPNLAGIDPQAVAAFIKHRRENTPGADQSAAAPLSAVAKIPVLEPSKSSWLSDREPLGYWFFGHRDYGARLIAIGAVVAVVVIAAAAVFDATESRVRASAYAAIVAAAPQDDEDTVVGEAKRFLTARTLRRADPRDDQVRTLLAEAQDAPRRRVRDAATAEAEAALKRGDDLAVMRAIEKFASAPPLNKNDTRAASLREIYAREFVRWFAGLDARANADVLAQSETYKRVSVQLARMAGEVE